MDNKVRIDISQAPWVECSEGSKIFETKLLFKKISALMSPTAQTEHVPLETIVCQKCGKVPKFFWEKAKDIPEDIKSQCDF
jgi:hypothetical protein